MGYYKAVFNLNRPIKEKAPDERSIAAKMAANPLFADPPIPYLLFSDAIDAQTLAVDNAEFGGIGLIALMHTKERIVDDMIRKYRDYVTERADNDTDIILSSGFRHTKPRASAGGMPKVIGIKNLNSQLSGGLKLKWTRVDNVAFYEVDTREVEQVVPFTPTPGNPTPSPSSDNLVLERPWKTTASKGTRIEITDLKPLRYYEVRVRAKGAKGYGGYSDIVVMAVT